MRLRPVILVVVLAGAAVAVAAVATRDGRGTRSADDAATIGRAATTLPPPPSTTVAPTTTTAAPRVLAEPTPTWAREPVEEAPGLVITNSGSATATVGGNVVSGGPGGPGAGQPPATVVTGDAIAVGNSSSVRTP